MSKVESNTKEVKAITPLLQAILLKQIDRVGEALDMADYIGAFRRLRTLWGRTPPKAQKMCETEYNSLLAKFANTDNINGVDAVDTIGKRTVSKSKILEVSVRPVYDKIVSALYEGGYLEKYDTTPTGHEIPF